jgi:hypothetical protein
MNHATYDEFIANATTAGLTVNESNVRGPEHRYATVTCPCSKPGAIFEVRSKEGALAVQSCTAGCAPGTISDALTFAVAPGDTSRERFTMTRLADVQPETVEWIWPGRLPAGKLVTLDGDPGLGKSTLAIGIAATITTGGNWPDGTACTVVGDVLLMSAEDGMADTVRPRLDAAGADVTKVHNIDGVRSDTDGTLRPPTLADVAPIERAVNATGARLLVVDVIMAFLPSGTDSHKDQDIRRVLSRLAGVADRTGCTVLLLRHLNKAKGGDPMYRGGGSIGIVGAARAGMLVAADPDDPELRVLASIKSNLGPPAESLAYRLVGAGDHGAARVQWEGTTEHTARTLLADTGSDDGDERSEIAKIIRDYLTDPNGGCGSAPAGEVLRHTRAAGYADAAVKKARSKAGVQTKRIGFGKGASWHWSIDIPIDPIDARLSGTGSMEPMPESMPDDPSPGEPPSTSPSEASPAQQTPRIPDYAAQLAANTARHAATNGDHPA